MADPQNFIDRMLEVENLTDALEDEEADFLVNWGIAKLKGSLAKINDYEEAGEYTNDLMAFIRTVNQIAGDLENIQPEKLAQLAERRINALEPGDAVGMVTCSEAAAQLATMSTHQALEYLLQNDLKEN